MIQKSILVMGCCLSLTIMTVKSAYLGTVRTASAPATAASMHRVSYANLGQILMRGNSGSGGAGGGSSYGGLGGGGSYGGLRSSVASQAAASSGQASMVPIAIQTRHNIEYKEVPSSGSIHTANVEVGARSIPINILFRSASSSLNVLQQHQGAGGDTQESESEDEPHRLVHTVTKPIIQEIHEVISPFRKITQEVQPVQEEIQTIVARNTQKQQQQQQQYQQQQSKSAVIKAQQSPQPIQLQATVLAPPLSTFEAIDLNDPVTLSKSIYSGNGLYASSSNTNHVINTSADAKSVQSGLDKSLSQSVQLVLETSPNKSINQSQGTKS